MSRADFEFTSECEDEQLAPAHSQENEQVEFGEDALASRFTLQHGENLRFTAELGRWSEWNGRLWKTDTTNVIIHYVRQFLREECKYCDDPHLARRITSAATVAAIERLARADRRHSTTVDQWDSNPSLLNTPDGVVDLRTGAIRNAARDDCFTKTTSVAPVGDCPEWLTFLARVTNADPDLQNYIQRMCGYFLTGLTREHALFFLYGTGANGKSVFISTIAGLMGDYAKTAPAEAFMECKGERHPTEIAGLQGARLVTVQETENGRYFAEAKLKTLTGGDRIVARYMRQDFFEYLPQFKLLFAGNHKPALRTVDEGMRRRFNLLPFSVTVPQSERDQELTQKLQAEWSGIMKWMIDGCLSWQALGLTAPNAVVEATEDYFVSEDKHLRWIQDGCDLETDGWESATDLFESFKDWATENGEQPGSQKAFSESLARRKGISSERKSKARGFRGIRLRKVL